jgi:polyisoprenoid-binding protein YceI
LSLNPQNTRITFVGSAGPMSHSGSFTRFEGQMYFPTDDPRDARLTIEIDQASVHTNISLLTRHLKGKDFFDVEKYPKANFMSDRIEPSAAGEGLIW